MALGSLFYFTTKCSIFTKKNFWCQKVCHVLLSDFAPLQVAAPAKCLVFRSWRRIYIYVLLYIVELGFCYPMQPEQTLINVCLLFSCGNWNICFFLIFNDHLLHFQTGQNFFFVNQYLVYKAIYQLTDQFCHMEGHVILTKKKDYGIIFLLSIKGNKWLQKYNSCLLIWFINNKRICFETSVNTLDSLLSVGILIIVVFCYTKIAVWI